MAKHGYVIGTGNSTQGNPPRSGSGQTGPGKPTRQNQLPKRRDAQMMGIVVSQPHASRLASYQELLDKCLQSFAERCVKLPEDCEPDVVVQLAQGICENLTPWDLEKCFAIILSDSELATMKVAFGDSELVRDSATVTILQLMRLVISQTACADIMMLWWDAHDRPDEDQ